MNKSDATALRLWETPLAGEEEWEIDSLLFGGDDPLTVVMKPHLAATGANVTFVWETFLAFRVQDDMFNGGLGAAEELLGQLAVRSRSLNAVRSPWLLEMFGDAASIEMFHAQHFVLASSDCWLEVVSDVEPTVSE